MFKEFSLSYTTSGFRDAKKNIIIFPLKIRQIFHLLTFLIQSCIYVTYIENKYNVRGLVVMCLFKWRV